MIEIKITAIVSPKIKNQYAHLSLVHGSFADFLIIFFKTSRRDPRVETPNTKYTFC